MTAILAKHGLQTLFCMLVVCTSVEAMAEGEAETEEAPDMAFLEYLGIWDETDEDWLLLDDDVIADNEERRDPVPQGKESTEKRDES
jgi:hypothetical protein